jgi:prepilin-type processing-associated H-X9-DG protein
MNNEMPETYDDGDKPVPTGLRRISPSEIEMTWSDGLVLLYRASHLRKVCPCATCRERRRDGEPPDPELQARAARQLPVLSKAEAKPMTIDKLRPVGNYAYNIAFGDGHSSGLFTLEFLRQHGVKSEE